MNCFLSNSRMDETYLQPRMRLGLFLGCGVPLRALTTFRLLSLPNWEQESKATVWPFHRREVDLNDSFTIRVSDRWFSNAIKDQIPWSNCNFLQNVLRLLITISMKLICWVEAHFINQSHWYSLIVKLDDSVSFLFFMSMNYILLCERERMFYVTLCGYKTFHSSVIVVMVD